MYIGLGAPLGNLGEISNKGTELALTFREKQKAFKYSATVIVSHNKNEVLKVANKDGYVNGSDFSKGISGSLRMEEGFSYPYFYGYETDGIFQNESEIENYTFTDENGVISMI